MLALGASQYRLTLRYVVHIQGEGVGHAVDVHGVDASGQTVHVERDGLLKGNNFRSAFHICRTDGCDLDPKGIVLQVAAPVDLVNLGAAIRQAVTG